VVAAITLARLTEVKALLESLEGNRASAQRIRLTYSQPSGELSIPFQSSNKARRFPAITGVCFPHIGHRTWYVKISTGTLQNIAGVYCERTARKVKYPPTTVIFDWRPFQGH
jgi:hypothetical protein